MADLGFGLNTEEEAAGYRAGFTVIPPGWYDVVIVESESKPTASGTGKMLVLTMELQDGSRRTVIDRLNIINTSEKAQQIARQTLGKISQSIGHKGLLTNTDVLHGRRFSAKVEVEEFESNTEAGKMLQSNKVKEYRAAGAQSSAPALAGATATKKAW